MKIDIIDKSDLLTHITVRVFEDDELVYCDHANRTIEYIDYGSPIDDDYRQAYTCDKCDWIEQTDTY